jgi:hypothetical protein
MNWLQKISSVTFSLDGGEKISQPKTISDLSYDLGVFARKAGANISFRDIDSDGDDFDKMEGTINWYVSNNVPEDQQKQVMQQWVQEMNLMDYVIQVSGPEQSGMSTPEQPLQVYRLKVVQNGSKDYMQIPSMNLANSNARALIESLGIPFDWGGSVDLNELTTKLDMFNPWQQQELIQEPESGGGEGTGTVGWHDFGRSEDQVSRYVSGLKEMVDFGLQNGFQTLVWG